MKSQDTLAWRSLEDLSGRLEMLLDKADAGGSSVTDTTVTPPQLGLRDVAVRKLEAIYAKQQRAQPQSYAQVMREHLFALASTWQNSFASHWTGLDPSSPPAIDAQKALQRMYLDRFERYIEETSKMVMCSFDEGGRAGLDEADVPETQEWSDASRMLMEQVYHRHPRLEPHEKKLLSEASGLSIRQISVWFANQRQRRGWPVQEEAVETPAAAPATRSTPVSTSSRSQLGVLGARSVSPNSPTISSTGSVAGDTSACPSLSSSVSSRSSSGAWTSSPTRAHFGELDDDAVRIIQEASRSLSSSTSSTLSNPGHAAPLFDADQLVKQLSNTQQKAQQQQLSAQPQPSQQWSHVSFPAFDAARNDISTNPTSTNSWIAPQQTVFQDVKPDITQQTTISPLQTSATVIQPPTLSNFDFNVSQWMPVAKPAGPAAFTTASSSILPPGDNTASAFSFSFTAPTPKADQPAFAPLQLDTSMYFGAADSFLGMKPNTILASTDTGMDAFLSTSCKASPEASDASSVADVAVPPAVAAKTGDAPSQTCFWDDFKHLLAEDVPDPHTVFLKSTENWEELFKQDFSVWSDPNNSPISASS